MISYCKIALTALISVIFLSLGFSGTYAQQITQSKQEPKKVDIILLQDESGSMDNNDPHNIRKIVATSLFEGLEIAGEGNRMALILFGAKSDVRVGLSRNFDRIRQESEAGVPRHSGPNDRKNPEGVPLRGYTDIYGALKAAEEILLKDAAAVSSPSRDDAVKEKHVILLTDGEMSPWPGLESRYGDLAADYLRCLERSKFKSCDNSFLKRAVKKDREYLFDRAGLLARFKDKGWRVHCLGFSDGVDVNLLNQIASATYGHAGIARDHTQLLPLLQKTIPPAPNVVVLRLQDFCDTMRVEETVDIAPDIKAVQFKVDLSRMLASNSSIRPQNLEITVTDPHGNTVNSFRDTFRFNTTKSGLVVTASYFKERPQPGTWKMLVVGKGANICGQVKISGKVPFAARMEFVPEMSAYFGSQKVGIKVDLRNEETATPVPMQSVTAKLIYSRTEAGSVTHEERDIPFEVAPGGESATASVQIPTGIKGKAAIETTVIDREYGSTIKEFRTITLGGDIREVTINFEPEIVNLGIVGDETTTVTSEPIHLTSPDPLEFELECIRPRLELGGKEIPFVWVNVNPKMGMIGSGKSLDVVVSVSLPVDAVLDLPEGIYKGDLKIEAKSLQGECVIPVELDVRVPSLILEPSRLDTSDFKWRLSAVKTQTLEIGHSSNRDRTVRMVLPRFLKHRQGRNESKIHIRVEGFDGEKPQWEIAPGEMITAPVQVSLGNLNISRKQRIRKGTYTGTIRVLSEGLNSEEMTVKVKIPDLPLIVKYGRPGVHWLTVFLGALLALGTFLFIHRSWKKLFTKKYKFRMDDLDKVGQRLECSFQGGKDTNGMNIVAIPAGGLNADVVVKDTSTGGYVDLPNNGISNIENFMGGALTSVKTDSYEYKPSRVGKSLVIKVKNSPYGSRFGYLFKRVLLPLLLCILSALAYYWIIRIV